MAQKISKPPARRRKASPRVSGAEQAFVDFFCDVFRRESIPFTHVKSIRRFIDRLGMRTADAAKIAVERVDSSYAECSRYFCGVCWNMTGDLEAEEGDWVR